MRGRRASSLIEAGSSRGSEFNIEALYSDDSDSNHADIDSKHENSEYRQDDENHAYKIEGANWDSMDTALPHNEVETNEFYKHISQDLVEPKRMRQLLLWCGHRALPEKSVGGQTDAAETAAVHAARVIQEELLNEFSSRNNLSYWYDREDTTPTVLVKTPNPRNIQNAERLLQLQEEKRTWDDLLASTAPPKPSAETTDAESSSQALLDISPRSINPSLLDPSQADHLQTLLSSISLNPSESSTQTSTLETTKTRIGTIASSLEFKIDKLADGAHKLEQYTAGAQRLADRVLAVGAEKLEERDRNVREKSGGTSGQVDAMDKLRGLSRVLNRRG
ncbi:hypothetical protein E4T45_12019 [Aureobasidium sp. EXF-8846]|nr:hypothetical protein E4T45_12019 [Aureobasidium sp. EXF-8846]